MRKPDEIRPPAKPANGKSPTDCQVNGCPLPGVYRTSNDASICCVHDGEDPHAWAEQTERIKRRLRLWWLTLSMSNAPVGEPVKQVTIDAVLAERGPNADGAKTQRAYAQQIRAFLLKECKGEHKIPQEVVPLKALVAKLTSSVH